MTAAIVSCLCISCNMVHGPVGHLCIIAKGDRETPITQGLGFNLTPWLHWQLHYEGRPHPCTPHPIYSIIQSSLRGQDQYAAGVRTKARSCLHCTTLNVLTNLRLLARIGSQAGYIQNQEAVMRTGHSSMKIWLSHMQPDRVFVRR